MKRPVSHSAAEPQSAARLQEGPGRGRISEGFAVLIDRLGTGVADHGLVISAKALKACSHERRSPQVIVSCPHEEGRLRKLEGAVEIARCAFVALGTEVADPIIPGSGIHPNLSRAVRRGVVRDDQLEVAEILLEKGPNGFAEVNLTVEDRQPDTKDRRHSRILATRVARDESSLGAV